MCSHLMSQDEDSDKNSEKEHRFVSLGNLDRQLVRQWRRLRLKGE